MSLAGQEAQQIGWAGRVGSYRLRLIAAGSESARLLLRHPACEQLEVGVDHLLN